MVKTIADDITKRKKKITEGDEESSLDIAHFKSILIFADRRIYSVTLKCSLFLLAFIFAFLLLEITARFFEEKNFGLSPCQSQDEDLHHVMIPNSECRFKTEEWDVNFKLNSSGLRDEEFPLEKKDDRRILVLGDSFGQGFGVDINKSFVNILEKKLASESNNRVRVINASVLGYSPLIEYLYLMKKGLKFKPDMVILEFSLTEFYEDRLRFSDLKNTYPNLNDQEIAKKIEYGDIRFSFGMQNQQAENGKSRDISSPFKFYKIKQWVLSHSKVYAAIVDKVVIKDRITQQDIIYQGNIDKDIVALVRGEQISTANWEKLWELPVRHLKLINSLLSARNIPFVVVVVPDGAQVSDSEWPNKKALGYPDHFEDPRGPFGDELRKRLASENIFFIDLLSDFKKSDAFPLYFTNDGHWRESGHKLAAEVIFQRIRGLFSENILPIPIH